MLCNFVKKPDHKWGFCTFLNSMRWLKIKQVTLMESTHWNRFLGSGYLFYTNDSATEAEGRRLLTLNGVSSSLGGGGGWGEGTGEA